MIEITAVAIVGLTLCLWAYAFWFNRVELPKRIRELRTSASSNAVEGRIRKAESAHAARARKMISEDVAGRDVFIPNIVMDLFEQPVETAEKYVGIVAGSSCRRFGFRDGAVFLGDKFGDTASLKVGDFVVIQGPATSSNVGRRIRRIEKVSDLIEFTPDESGRPHRARSRRDIIAKITHVLA